MKQIIYTIYTVALISFISLKGYCQTIKETNTNPAQTQKQCSYYYADASGLSFNSWLPPSNCAISATGGTFNLFLYLKWQNIEASAYPSIIQAQFQNSLYQTITASLTVSPFVLTLPVPSFVDGSSKNIPCHATSPVTISLNSYKNTSNNAIDYNTVITSQFKWTLPAGWQTINGETGSFVSGTSITVIPPVTYSAATISVMAKANTQYSAAATFQITRNLEAFSIDGPTTVTYNSINRYTVPSYPGVSYSWQLPSGLTGQSTTNYIDVTAGCGSGNITATMNVCNGSKTSTKAISFNVNYPGSVISGPSDICSSGAYSVNNIPTGATVTWSLSNAGIVSTPSPAAGFSTSLTALTEGIVFLRANITYSCGSYTISKRINAQSLATDFSIQASVPCQPGTIIQISTFTAVPSSPSLTYHWRYVKNGISTNITGSGPSITKKLGLGSYQIFAWAYNSCVETEEVMSNFNVIACRSFKTNSGTTDTYSLTISPNPSSSETTLELKCSDGKEMASDVVWDLEIYDSMQNIKTKNSTIRGNKKNIETSGWGRGVYIVRVKFENEIISGKFQINP